MNPANARSQGSGVRWPGSVELPLALPLPWSAGAVRAAPGHASPSCLPWLLWHSQHGTGLLLALLLTRGRNPFTLHWWRRGKQFAGKMTLSSGKLPLTAAAQALVIPGRKPRHGVAGLLTSQNEAICLLRNLK